MSMHALTIDVEDWYHVENLKPVAPPERWETFEGRLEPSMKRLLDLFDARGVKSTCFVLGRAAERHPAVVKEIVRRGHELACHGWSHDLITRQTPALFREETRRAKSFLEDLGGVPVRGYRASTFSVTAESLWALDILAELGFVYDSSIAPLRHDRYGIPGERGDPHVRQLAGGRRLVEFPVGLMRVLGWRFPLGGGFFRLFPLSWTARGLRACEKRGEPGMLYLHPWEVDAEQPRVAGLGALRRFRHYARLSATLGKLDTLLRNHRWGTMAEILAGRGLL